MCNLRGVLFLFAFEQCPFPCYHLTLALAVEAAQGAIGGNDTMAWHFGSEGVAPEGLADSLGRAAANALSQFLVGYGLSSRNFEEGEIDLPLEFRDFQ